MTTEITNKHITITGAASGIGKATVEVLAERGAILSLADIDQHAGQALAEQLSAQGAKATFYALDVSNSQQVKQVFAQLHADSGACDVLINSAGIEHTPAPFHQVPDEALEKNFAVNVQGTWYCIKQALPGMLQQKKGHIINLASVAGLRSSPLTSAYAASKHAVVGLSKTLAVEYAQAGIRVNAVCPSFVRTPMVERAMKEVGEEKAKKFIAANPMRRLGEPAEIANAIAWLCTDESSFMTGHSVVLDGGMLA